MRALLAALLLCAITSAQARDDGTYATRDPAMHVWFDHLASKKGLCCSFADGRTVADPDWGTEGDHYWVTVDGQKLVVPDEAVVTEPNKFGQTIVWPVTRWDGRVIIRCFMKGIEG